MKNKENYELQKYDKWNDLKKKIDIENNQPNRFPKEGEVWMSAFGKNIGFEQDGGGENFARPVLIVKKFNNHMFWCVPLSTKQKDLDFYFNFTDQNNMNVSAILAQMRLASVKRLKRKMYDVPNERLNEMKEKLKSLLL